jgi:hypothetical protein
MHPRRNPCERFLICAPEKVRIRRLSARCDCDCGVANLAQLYPDLRASVTLAPDDKGRVAGTLTLSDVNLSTGGPCTCGGQHVEYFCMTLTNLITGHVYRLDSFSRDYPWARLKKRVAGIEPA